jgi:uncharacterized repeat protein (TIGR02543 family)
MKKRTLWLTLEISSAFFVGMSLSSCSFIKSKSEDAVYIKSISTQAMDDGSTQITITYLDSAQEPTVFTIPAGTEGNGIKDITYKTSDDKTYTDVVISYTDTTMANTEVVIPSGVSITGVESSLDGEGNTVLTVNYSDGSKSNPITVGKGAKGDTGNGIQGIDQVINQDKSVTLTFHFTTSDDVKVTIPAPVKGDTGVGIEAIVSKEDDTNYYIELVMTDGTVKDLAFTRPTNPNNWYQGSTAPAATLGKNGDYYFDTFHGQIYSKQNGAWTNIITFETSNSTVEYTVTFNLNDSTTAPASMPVGASNVYTVKRGTYFSADVNGYGSIPIPTRTGYTFNGWYTSKIVTPTTGCFTELTPVFSNLTLYAYWLTV